MRLSCSNCGAVYEVPDAAIPAGGRDVQCTNCGHVWFHEGPGARPPEPVAPEVEDGPPLRRPPVDPEVRKVLREEAEREIEARRDEARRPRPVEEEPVRRPAPTTRIEPPTAEEAGLSPAAAPRDDRPTRRRTGGGFLTGFVLTLLAAGALAAAYAYDEAVVEAAPAAAGSMASYVAAVDDARAAVNDAAGSLVAWVEGLLPPEASGG